MRGTKQVFYYFCCVVLGLYLFRYSTDVFAQYGAHQAENPTGKDYLYRLLRSGFGTLVMIFSGLSGFAFLYMKREGKGSGQTPVLGIFLLLLAIVLFVFRVMITSGMLGSQYLDYGQ